jgi:soluble lytic murein transglycosylase-like protein
VRGIRVTLSVLAFCAVQAVQGCASDAGSLQGPEAKPPTGLQPQIDAATAESWPSTDPNSDPNGPALQMMITKSMLYAAGMKHGVNPYLVMGLAWHESGWQASVVSSAGAVGIMQVMPATAAADGPALLNRIVNLYDPDDNIDMGTAILKNNLNRYNNDLAKALTAYYAGGSAVTEWGNLRADCRRYVWAVYNAAMMFKEGKGPA